MEVSNTGNIEENTVETLPCSEQIKHARNFQHSLALA